jgi:hypothetical protein
MKTVGDLERELRTLRQEVRQLRGPSNQEVISELVGDEPDSQMQPTPTGWSTACAQGREQAIQIKESRARDSPPSP